jgi:hypothetical protein
MTRQTICLLLCIRFRGNVFTKPFPSNDTHIDTDRWEGFVKYVVEMGSSALIHIPSFIRISLGIQKLIGRIHRHTHGQYGDRISPLLFFFQNNESRLKTA